LLSVFDNGKITNLPGWATAGYVAGDSIIGYYDDNSGSYQIYHDGIAEPFPEILQDTSYSSFIAGDNILAYKGPGSRLEAYFHGVIYDLGTNEASSYKPGMNIVAFMDEFSQSFNVFYDGKITKLENLAPKSYRAGDNLVAYVDYSGNFKIFYKGDVTIIASTEQDFYSVVHNVVVFGTDNVNFSVFFKGENFLLETMLPIQHKEDYNSVGYIDAYGYLKLFSEGRTYEVSPFKLSKFVLTQNVLRYNLGLNDIHFFLNGKTY
jgi:hypothetical protein